MRYHYTECSTYDGVQLKGNVEESEWNYPCNVRWNGIPVSYTHLDGTYLYTQDSGKIMNEKITDSKNSSLAKVGTKMLDSDSGKACFTEGITGYTVYYETIPDLEMCIRDSNKRCGIC